MIGRDTGGDSTVSRGPYCSVTLSKKNQKKALNSCTFSVSRDKSGRGSMKNLIEAKEPRFFRIRM